MTTAISWTPHPVMPRRVLTHGEWTLVLSEHRRGSSRGWRWELKGTGGFVANGSALTRADAITAASTRIPRKAPTVDTPTKILLWKRTDSRKGAILKAEAEIVYIVDCSNVPDDQEGTTIAIVLGLDLARAFVKATWPKATVEEGG